MYNYIIIDDNRIDLLVASKAIEISHKAVVEVHQFLSASIALEFVKNNATPFLTIMLIDIQMPLMNGFEFMEEFEKLPDYIKQNYICMFLTSSLNDLDRIRAQKYPSIKQFINKPFTSDTLLTLLKSL
ncbi:MAG: response regulator [Bacteroidia bacterium]|nr:response regulator [Bacteroidia bacterium]MBP9688212.1 response regulator [Bacteroidia bacterium]